MTTKITKKQKAIADAHIKAWVSKEFNPIPSTLEEAVEGLKRGEVYEELMRKIEARYISMTSTLIMAVWSEPTNAYKQGIYKGFKTVLNTMNIT